MNKKQNKLILRKILSLVTTLIIMMSLNVIMFAYFSMRVSDTTPATLDVNDLFGRLTAPTNPNAMWGTAENPFLIHDERHLNNLYVLQNTKNHSLINENSVFQVSLPNGNPCYVGGGANNGTIELMSIPSIGSEDFPFVSTLRGVTTNLPGAYITLPTGEISDTSVLGNLQVIAYEGQIDIGLFGNVGKKANAGDITAQIYNLLLANIQVKTNATGDLAKDTSHDFFANALPHETNHIGILVGHAQYCAIYDISVYYSANGTGSQVKAAVEAFNISEGKSETKYTTAGGIIGFYKEMIINPNDTLHPVNSEYLPNTAGGSATGLGLGIIYSEDIWSFMEKNYFGGMTIPNETYPDTEYAIKDYFGPELYGQNNPNKQYFQIGMFTFAHSKETINKDRVAKLWKTNEDNYWRVATNGQYENETLVLDIDAKIYECKQLTADDFARNSATMTSANYFYETLQGYNYNNYRFMIVAEETATIDNAPVTTQYAMLRIGDTASAQRIIIENDEITLPSSLLEYYTYDVMNTRTVSGSNTTFSNPGNLVVTSNIDYPANYTQMYDISLSQTYDASYTSNGNQIIPITGTIYFNEWSVPFSYTVTMPTGDTATNLTVNTGNQTISIGGINVRVNFLLTYDRVNNNTTPNTYTYSNLRVTPNGTFQIGGTNSTLSAARIGQATYPVSGLFTEIDSDILTIEFPSKQFNETYNSSTNTYTVPVMISINGSQYAAGNVVLTAPTTNTTTNYTTNTTLVATINGISVSVPVTLTYTAQRTNATTYDYRNLRIAIANGTNILLGNSVSVAPSSTGTFYSLSRNNTTIRGYIRTAISSNINQFMLYGSAADNDELPLRIYDVVSFMKTSVATAGEGLKVYMQGSGSDTSFMFRRAGGYVLSNYLCFDSSQGFYSTEFTGNIGPSNAYNSGNTRFKIYAINLDPLNDDDMIKQINTPTDPNAAKQYDMRSSVLFYRGNTQSHDETERYRYDIMSMATLSWSDNQGLPILHADATLKMGDPTAYYYLNNTYTGVLLNIPSPNGAAGTIMVPYGAIGFTVNGNGVTGGVRPKSKVFVIVATDPMQLVDEQVIEISYLNSSSADNGYTLVDSFILPPLPGSTMANTTPIYIYDADDDQTYQAYPNMNTILVAYEFEVDIMATDRTYFLSSSKGTANFVYLSAERVASNDTNPNHVNDLVFPILAGIDYVTERNNVIATINSENYLQTLIVPYFGMTANPDNLDGSDPTLDTILVLQAKDFNYNIFRYYDDSADLHVITIDILMTGPPWSSGSITEQQMIEIMNLMNFNFTSGSYLDMDIAKIIYSDVVKIFINGIEVDWRDVYNIV